MLCIDGANYNMYWRTICWLWACRFSWWQRCILWHRLVWCVVTGVPE